MAIDRGRDLELKVTMAREEAARLGLTLPGDTPEVSFSVWLNPETLDLLAYAARAATARRQRERIEREAGGVAAAWKELAEIYAAMLRAIGDASIPCLDQAGADRLARVRAVLRGLGSEAPKFEADSAGPVGGGLPPTKREDR
jgi:nucleotide-binding universal stress UspA family protein